MTTYYTFTNFLGNSMIIGIGFNGTVHYIPIDPANTDYANYLAWVTAGNTAEPYTG
jgi:hypothetical protein